MRGVAISRSSAANPPPPPPPLPASGARGTRRAARGRAALWSRAARFQGLGRRFLSPPRGSRELDRRRLGGSAALRRPTPISPFAFLALGKKGSKCVAPEFRSRGERAKLLDRAARSD